MSILSKILVVLVAMEFLYILYLETFATASKATSKVFGLGKKELSNPNINTLLKNQGVYNGLISAGLIYTAFFFVGAAGI